MKLITIYVKLEDEGVNVLRPASAKEIETGVYELQSESSVETEDEVWEFPPGSLVKGEERLFEGEKILVAVHL